MQSPWLIVFRRLAVVAVATALLVGAAAMPGVLLSNRRDADERQQLVDVHERFDELLRDPEAIERLRQQLEANPPEWFENERLPECLLPLGRDRGDCERP